MLLEKHHDAYAALQQAVYRDSTISAFWNTIAILYRTVNQNFDALEAVRRAISINPLRYQYWYNQGVLVSDGAPFVSSVFC
jgi:Tfp pilus assembly protein PilF